MMFTQDYRSTFIKIATDILSDEVYYYCFNSQTTHYSAYDFFIDRTKIGNKMLLSLNTIFMN